MKYALINSVIYTKNEVLRDYAVVIEGEYIQSVIPQSELESGIKTIDLKGHNLTAGFIDLQLNGCGGVMFNDQTSVETLEIMQATNLKSGCTSFLPTFITAPDEDIKRAVNIMREYLNKHKNQADPGWMIPGLEPRRQRRWTAACRKKGCTAQNISVKRRLR